MKSPLKIPVIFGEVLGVKVCRGFAPAYELALISKADIYDRKKNPTGTQRDLSPKHAKDAYEYIKTSKFGFWPEVFLSVRNQEPIKIMSRKRSSGAAILHIDNDLISNGEEIYISRLDGNHRLHYADGLHSGFSKITKKISFCLAFNLDIEQEITLFRDINDNQRRMNTSHLDNIEARLTEEDELKRLQPQLYLAKKLATEKTSPFCDMVYEGGKKEVGAPIPIRSLKTGLNYLYSRSSKLSALDEVDAQYKVIENYFTALKKWQPNAWKKNKEHLILRGAGFWGVCFLGAEVIDRALSNGQYQSDKMLEILKSGKDWDWSNTGDFKGLSGRGGALRISEMITAEFIDKSGMSMKQLARQIVDS